MNKDRIVRAARRWAKADREHELAWTSREFDRVAHMKASRARRLAELYLRRVVMEESGP